ncbi:MAG: aminotransferase class V-fold PLP-dependent enzyme [Thermogladius sp.]|jgi:tyrosine decarboxylase/aspartate 1-decarboxylase|nr:aminotransferase class V-fold PLP-dependent enzyme [Thermogladius sp.]
MNPVGGGDATRLLRELLEIYSKTTRHEDSILGSMTTTPNPLAIYAFTIFSHTNLADLELFSSLKDMYKDVLDLARRIYGSNLGYVTAGATESNLIALYVARETHGGSSNIVVAPDTVHFSVEKACRFLGCRLVKIPVGNKPLDPGLLVKYVREYSPFAIVVTAGTTELGLVDPIKEVAEIASTNNVYLHVDAAYGGLIIPFLYERGLVKENVYFYKGVSSIAVDFHKFAGAPPPAGLILFSNEDYLNASCFEYSYTISGKICGVLGTRPGGSLAGIWAVLRGMGLDYLRERALWAFNAARELFSSINSIKGFEAVEPETTIVAFRHKRLPSNVLSAYLAERGLFLYKAPSIGGLRVVVMPHFNKALIGRLLRSLSDISRSTPHA